MLETGIILTKIPRTCKECPHKEYDDYNDDWICPLTNFNNGEFEVGYRLIVDFPGWDKKRHDCCPIKRLPEKKDAAKHKTSNKDWSADKVATFFDGYDHGFNDCLEKILKENK